MESRLDIQRKLVKELVRRRKDVGLSQKKLALLSGVSLGTIRNIEQDYFNGRVVTWQKLNNAIQKLEMEVK